MIDASLCQGEPCAVPFMHRAHGDKYLSADEVERVWRPGPRPSIGQYTVTLTVTGDDLGMETLGTIIPPLLRCNLGMSSVNVVEITTGYPVPPKPVPAPRTVRIHQGFGRTVRVYLDGEQLAYGNYDEHGWSGLEMISSLATKIADAAGLTVTACEGDDRVEEHCDDGDHEI